MKKVLLFFGFGFFAFFSAQSQQLTESFEQGAFPPAGWKTVTVRGNPWMVTRIKANNGYQSAYKEYEQINNGYNGEGESWLISPKIYQIQNGDKVSFYLASGYSEVIPLPAYDSLIVYISATGNNPGDFTTILKKISMSQASTSFVLHEVTIPPAFVGQDVYIGFHHLEIEGNSIFLDDFSAGSELTNDLKSHAINLQDEALIKAGSSITITDTLINNGTSTIPAGIPIRYSVNGGAVRTVNTTASLAPGQKTYVTFSGTNAYTASAAGTFTLKVYSDWAVDANRSNDTFAYTMLVQEPKTSFPYFTDFNDAAGWTQTGNAPFVMTSLVFNQAVPYPIIDPTGIQSKAAFAATYQYVQDSFVLRTPLLDFSGLENPMLNFYVAAGNWDKFNDSLQVLISLDGGVTFEPTGYDKSYKSTSKLQTVHQKASEPIIYFTPDRPADWRHEIVNLANYAGQSNVVLAFKLKSEGGNNVLLDHVKIFDQPKALYSATNVTTAGLNAMGPYNSSVQFLTIAAPDSIRFQGHNFMAGEPNFVDNTTATSNNGTISSPNVTVPRYWTIAYSGNSDVRATYNISLDITGLNGITESNKDSLYILKRADEAGPWTALTTTRVGNILTASGLTYFSDFTVGYFSKAVPVTVLSFNGKASGNGIDLNWNTSQEANILSYDIQKYIGSEWVKIGSRESLRISMQNDYSFTDINPLIGINLYRLMIYSEMGSAAYSDVAKVMYSLSSNKVYQNVPNPVGNYTIIRYDLAKAAHVKVVVFDTYGRQISVLENTYKQPGFHQARWEAANVPSGTYFYRVMIDDEVVSKSMLKLK